jgi:hypothetical protein
MIRRKAQPGSRRWRVGLAALVPVAALLGAFVTSATPASASFPGSNAPLTSSYVKGLAGLCLDVRDNNYQQLFDPVQVYTCNQTEAQVWKYDGNRVLLEEDPSKCLDIAHGGTSNGTLVDLYPCNGTGAQEWDIHSGIGILYNPQSGKCLDVTNRSANPGTQLQIWDCTGGDNQNWSWSPQIIQPECLLANSACGACRESGGCV